MSRPDKRNPMERLCPWCEEKIPKGAWACPECGADENTGWDGNDDARAESVDLPNTSLDEDDYGDFLHREFGGPYKKNALSKKALFRTCILVLVIVCLIAWWTGMLS